MMTILASQCSITCHYSRTRFCCFNVRNTIATSRISKNYMYAVNASTLLYETKISAVCFFLSKSLYLFYFMLFINYVERINNYIYIFFCIYVVTQALIKGVLKYWDEKRVNIMNQLICLSQHACSRQRK